jgi:hypothetical protein
MMMARVSFTSALPAIALLALIGCTPPHPHFHTARPFKTIGRLDCPTAQGELSLKNAAPDGRSCLYSGPDGAQVTLQLIDLQGGDIQGALAPLTADLRSELPAVQNKTAGGEKDNVDIDLPGIHIHAHDHGSSKSAVAMGSGAAAPSAAASGSNASVTVNGESDDAANIHIGGGDKGVVIDAGDNGAEIHISKGGGGANQIFILASDTAGPHGYKFVSYEARGPQAGPLAVVSVKSPGERDDNDDLRHEMGRLLQRNVGG